MKRKGADGCRMPASMIPGAVLLDGLHVVLVFPRLAGVVPQLVLDAPGRRSACPCSSEAGAAARCFSKTGKAPLRRWAIVGHVLDIEGRSCRQAPGCRSGRPPSAPRIHRPAPPGEIAAARLGHRSWRPGAGATRQNPQAEAWYIITPSNSKGLFLDGLLDGAPGGVVGDEDVAGETLGHPLSVVLRWNAGTP